MNNKTYIRKILRKIKVTSRIKARIKTDLQTEIEVEEEKGISLEAIIASKGTPEEVAASFNETYSDASVIKQYKIQRVLKFTFIFSFLIAILCISGSFVFGRIIIIGNGNGSIGIIGGVDGITNIYANGPGIGIIHTPPLAEFSGVAFLIGVASLTAFAILRKRH